VLLGPGDQAWRCRGLRIGLKPRRERQLRQIGAAELEIGGQGCEGHEKGNRDRCDAAQLAIAIGRVVGAGGFALACGGQKPARDFGPRHLGLNRIDEAIGEIAIHLGQLVAINLDVMQFRRVGRLRA
jgi:hypothetical protein